jgi:4-amino-4-deoxy-L-arabinose transferase-like glycosyltransferase
MPGTGSNKRIARTHLMIALGLLVVALVPRFLTASRAIWFDERFTLLNTGSIRDAMAYCTKDVHPPLYFLLAALWRMALPSTEFSLRILSLVFGTASLVGILLAGRAIGGWRTGIAGFLIAALSPYHWLYSTELRPYPMFLAFSAFSIWAFFGVVKSGQLRYFIILAISSILNLYTHYFAVFLLVTQILVFLSVVLRSSVSKVWPPAFRNRQILLGAAALGLVALAYAPWISVLQHLITRAVVEGQAVGVGRRIGRGVTLDLLRRTFYGSLGWGVVPFCLQVILVGWALLDRRLRDASLFFVAVWGVPLLMLLVWKPSHFIDPKYFLFAYPATVVLVAGGLETARRLLISGGMKSNLAFLILVVAVSASPLLPGQHPRYALNPADWKDVIIEIDQYVKSGDRICVLEDTKTYAMILHYADAEFLKRHPVVFSLKSLTGKGAAPSASDSDVWILRPGARSERLLSSMGNGLEYVRTWYMYPTSVSLYRWAPEGAGTAPGGIDSGRGSQ